MLFSEFQVIGHDKRPTARQVVKNLIAEDGWAGLYRGLGPRFFSMSAWGTTMILAYEYLSKAHFPFVHFFLLPMTALQWYQVFNMPCLIMNFLLRNTYGMIIVPTQPSQAI